MQSLKKFIAILIFAFVLLVSVFSMIVIAEAKEAGLPLHQKRFSDRVLIVWAGDAMQTIATVALATEKGIVVIETSLIRAHDSGIRKVIEKEFGRSDFKYLINTHYHHDHVCGNQVYAEATIIGHKNILAGMKEELTGEGLIKLVDKFKGMRKDREEAIQNVEQDSRDYHFLREFIICLEMAIEELQEGFAPTYPSIMFEKNMTLDMGDMTVELYSIGGMHTDSDIVVFVPEEGLVAIGDVAPDQMLPYIRKDLKSDFSVTLKNWGRIVESPSEIKYVNMAHSDMSLEVETYKEQYRYLRTLWDGLVEMKRKGLTIEDAKKRYTIEDDFPYFKDRIVQTRRGNIHQNNIEAIWDRI